MVAMETYLLLLISVLAIAEGQNYARQEAVLRSGQNGRTQGGPTYYDDDLRPPPPPFRPNPNYTPFNSNPRNSNSNYNSNNRQQYDRYPPARPSGSQYGDFSAPGARVNRYDVTPGGYDVTPGGYDVTPGSYDVTPGSYDVTPGINNVNPGVNNVNPGSYDVTPGSYDVTPRGYGPTPYEVQAAADDTIQANPTLKPATTTTTTTTAPTTESTHDHAHDYKNQDADKQSTDNLLNEEALELPISTLNETDDTIEVQPSSHVHTDENGHYGAFHASDITTILVSYWKTDNPEELFFSCLGIAALAVFYEGMAALKDWLIVRFTNSYQRKASCRKTLNYCGLHIAKTLVYMIQLTAAYLLMLIAMTYNIFLFVAVILGSGIGHVLFSVISYRSQASANI